MTIPRQRLGIYLQVGTDKEYRLPSGKTWETFEHDRVPLALRQQLDQLAEGGFVEHGVNLLAFGLPGTGKTRALCALRVDLQGD